MGKLLFIPFSVAAGLLAGWVGKRLFDALWGVVDDEEPPEPEHREVSWAKLAVAMAIQGAIFRAIRGLADHGSRHLFHRVTGSWPGEEEPEAT
jgi:hypothetical protein